MATGSADIAAYAKVSSFRTLPLSLFLSLSVFPFIFPCLSLSVSGLSIHIHLSDGSFWGAYSWHAGVFISTSNPFRVGLCDQSCHWQAAQASTPQQPSVLSSSWLYVITEEEQREASEYRLSQFLRYGKTCYILIIWHLATFNKLMSKIDMLVPPVKVNHQRRVDHCDIQ